ncbi:MAG: hypothetical protein ISR65_11910 [Bacteriovoracaceae bacterium]|nr:hypothetical protein [Bacteriovoracaceae bacterium]
MAFKYIFFIIVFLTIQASSASRRKGCESVASCKARDGEVCIIATDCHKPIGIKLTVDCKKNKCIYADPNDDANPNSLADGTSLKTKAKKTASKKKASSGSANKNKGKNKSNEMLKMLPMALGLLGNLGGGESGGDGGGSDGAQQGQAVGSPQRGSGGSMSAPGKFTQNNSQRESLSDLKNNLKTLSKKREESIKKVYATCLAIKQALTPKKKKKGAKKNNVITEDIKLLAKACGSYLQEIKKINNEHSLENNLNADKNKSDSCSGDHFAAIKQVVAQKQKSATLIQNRGYAADKLTKEINKQCKDIEDWSKVRKKLVDKFENKQTEIGKRLKQFLNCQASLSQQIPESIPHAEALDSLLALFNQSITNKLTRADDTLKKAKQKKKQKKKKKDMVKQKYKKFDELFKALKAQYHIDNPQETFIKSWNTLAPQIPTHLNSYRPQLGTEQNPCFGHVKKISSQVKNITKQFKKINKNSKKTLTKSLPPIEDSDFVELAGAFGKEMNDFSIDPAGKEPRNILGLTKFQMMEVYALASNIYNEEFQAKFAHPTTRFELWCKYKTNSQEISEMEKESASLVYKIASYSQEMLGLGKRSMAAGSLKVMATHFQSCDVIDFANSGKNGSCSPFVQNGQQGQSPRAIVGGKNSSRSNPQCIPTSDSQHKYRMGGKFSGSSNYINPLGNVDCSGFTSASMAASGLKWSSDQSGAYRSLGTAQIDGVTRSANSCFEAPVMDGTSSIKPGDLINSSNDHSMLVQTVGLDPFGVGGASTPSDCSRIGPAQLDFTVSHSSAQGLSGVQTTHVRNLRATRHVAQFVKMARQTCYAKVTNSQYQAGRQNLGSGSRGNRYFTIARHLGDKKAGCTTTPARLKGEECIQDCYRDAMKDKGCACSKEL